MTDEATQANTQQENNPDKPLQSEEKPQSKEARYRIRAREAETQAQLLRQNLTEARRAILNSASTNNHMIDPKAARDLYGEMNDSEVDALFTEQGIVDTDKFNTFITGQIEEKPYLRDTRPHAPVAFGVDRQPEPRNGNVWSQAFGQGQ